MNFSSRVLSSALLALAFTACGGSDNTTPATTADDTTGAPMTTGEPVTTGEPTTSGDGTTTDTPDPTTSGTSMGVDPCDSCDANASCDGEACVCDEGYEGDGTSCTDIDECAGDNECAVDATCSNTPGDYDCTCNVGYKGNGETCTDVDECTEDLDTCSNNADCANQDGSFKCTCKEGFTGDGMTCNGSKQFGDSCTAGEDCASGMCLAGEFDMCTVACSQAVANDCGAQGVTGLCVAVSVDMFWCAGDLTFGVDQDDEVMMSGDKVTRQFQSKTDADLFLVNIAVAGDYLIIATPDPDDDIQLDFYNADATELGTVNMLGIGEAESGVVTTQPGAFFVVARNIGNSNGGYTIEVIKQ
jgi:hypothetical protein